MAQRVGMVQGNADVPALTAGKRFRGYSPEAEKAAREVEVHRSEALAQITEAWRKPGSICAFNAEEKYLAMLKRIRGIRYTEKDVEDFSVILGDFQDDKDFNWKAGMFLSALINNGEGSGYALHIGHLVDTIDYIGYRNEKGVIVHVGVGDRIGWQMRRGGIAIRGGAGDDIGRRMEGGVIVVDGDAKGKVGWQMKGGSILVRGDAGDMVGFHMEGGSITVNGDADTYVGCKMEDGSISVRGDAGYSVGYGMKGGSISVEGKAGLDIGLEMKDGQISLEGGYGSISGNLKGGRIFLKGKLIAGK